MASSKRQSCGNARRGAGGFSLVEVLLAVFILGIGLIMVAAIFPVGAKWTAESTEESLAAEIAQNAVSTIQTRYPTLSSVGGVSSTTLGTLPSFATTVPISERAYQHGATNPYPASNPSGCVYFWTALARQSPGSSGSGKAIDLYIVVFRKGASEQTFTDPSVLTGCRASSGEDFVPVVDSVAYATGLSSDNPPYRDAVPRLGELGIGRESGTVFRQTVGASGPTPLPALKASEAIVRGMPPAGSSENRSPVVFIYQTTISY